MPDSDAVHPSVEELQAEIGTLRDRVSELEVALEECERQLQTIVDHAPVGIYFDDVDGTASFINAKCAELVGLPAESAAGFGWTAAMHPDDRERMVAAWEHAYKTSSRFRLEYRWLHPDGSIVWTLGEVAPILGDDGKATMFVGALTDITARKQVESQLRSSLEERDTLLRELHHRTRNNLQIVSSMINLRTIDESHPDTISRLAELEQRVASISIANDMIDESDIMTSINFHRYLEDLLAYITPAMSMGPTEISLTASLADINIPVDMAIPLGIAVTELVTNASKHAFGATASGTIKIELVSSHPAAATLLVRDNGTGFPADFDLAATLTPGLGTIRMLVEDQLDGKMTVRNDSGGIVSIDFDPRGSGSRRDPR